MRKDLIVVGTALIGIGVTPTPDDVTIISPLLQVVGGTALVVAGLVLNKND